VPGDWRTPRTREATATVEMGTSEAHRAGRFKDARGHRVTLIDPYALNLLRHYDVIPTEPLRIVARVGHRQNRETRSFADQPVQEHHAERLDDDVEEGFLQVDQKERKRLWGFLLAGWVRSILDRRIAGRCGNGVYSRTEGKAQDSDFRGRSCCARRTVRCGVRSSLSLDMAAYR